MDIKIGLACANESVCAAVGWGVGLLLLIAVAVFLKTFWSEWRKAKIK